MCVCARIYVYNDISPKVDMGQDKGRTRSTLCTLHGVQGGLRVWFACPVVCRERLSTGRHWPELVCKEQTHVAPVDRLLS